MNVYIDPIPTSVNQTWDYLTDEGLVWGVTTDPQSGEMLTLAVGSDYYADEYGHITWPLAAGTPVYAQVDSTNADTSYGAVLESPKITGRAYNNIGGPSYPAAVSIEGVPAPGNPKLDPVHNLPPRQVDR